MKRILALSFCLGLVLTQMVHADNNDKKHAKKAAAVAQHNAVQTQRRNLNVHRNVQLHNNAQFHRNVQAQHNVHVQQNLNAQRFNQAKINKANKAAAVNANVAARQYRHGNHRNVIVNRNNRTFTKNKVVVRNRNSYYQARQFNWHQRHDRGWWRHHYGNTRFVLFGGGYYFWNSGYWYPAYGYDPGYSTYTFDEPIYGPNEREPGQVISNVQVELQRAGYYDGEVDGLIGPNTREALARFQADQGLYVTRAIDEPTLEALGLA